MCQLPLNGVKFRINLGGCLSSSPLQKATHGSWVCIANPLLMCHKATLKGSSFLEPPLREGTAPVHTCIHTYVYFEVVLQPFDYCSKSTSRTLGPGLVNNWVVNKTAKNGCRYIGSGGRAGMICFMILIYWSFFIAMYQHIERVMTRKCKQGRGGQLTAHKIYMNLDLCMHIDNQTNLYCSSQSASSIFHSKS